MQSECQEFERSPMAWAKSIELKETFAKFQSERGKKTSDDNGSDDMISKAERKRKSDASPVEFCRRGLAVGNSCDSLADLLKITKLREVCADDEKEVQEIVQHLFTNISKPTRSKRDSQQATTHVDHMLLELVDEVHTILIENPFLDRAQELVQEAIDEHTNYNTSELDRSCQVKKEARRRRLDEQVAVNMHTMGTSFAGKVRDLRQIAGADIEEGMANIVDFQAQVSGHEATEKAGRIQARKGRQNPSSIFQTGSSPTDSKGTDLSYSCRDFREVDSTS